MLTLITMSSWPGREQMASVKVPPRSMAIRAKDVEGLPLELPPFGIVVPIIFPTCGGCKMSGLFVEGVAARPRGRVQEGEMVGRREGRISCKANGGGKWRGCGG